MSHQWKLPDRDRQIIDAFKKAGPRSAASRNSIEDVVSTLPTSALTSAEVANAILFMLFAQPGQHYNINDFVAVTSATERAKQINWNTVIRTFDVSDLRLHVESFTRLFRALLIAATEHQDFDIQNLWAGQWNNPRTQLSFLRAFFELQNVAPSQIPGFQAAFQVSQFEASSPRVREKVNLELEKHQSNFYALKAVFEVVLSDAIVDDDDAQSILHDLARNHLVLFLLSLTRITTGAGNFTASQDDFLINAFRMFLEDQRSDSDIALEALFHQDRQMVYQLCMMIFHTDPRMTAVITRKARQMGWVDFMLENFQNPMTLDIACVMQKEQSDFDIDQWLSQVVATLSRSEATAFGTTLWKFLRIKADDEYRTQKEEGQYQSISLSLSAVFALLWKVQELLEDRETIKSAQATCLTTYPRLMNYGTEFNEVLDHASDSKGHKLAPETDLRMSDLFGQMYRAEVSIRDMINEMRRYKTSNDPNQQDLFCCIVHGLFDEYGCYGEYPEEALEKTALLFGSIVKFRLLPQIPQEYGLILIVDAVRDQLPDTPMHRFGIEALLQLGDQLVEWPEICAMLLQIPTLQHSEIIQRAQEGLRNAQLRGGMVDREGHTDGMLNGASEEARVEATSRGFRSLKAEAIPPHSNFSDPDQKSQEKILFAVNNLSKENMKFKLAEMRDVLKPEHYHWFASYLVEQRARLEQNNQDLYRTFLSHLDDSVLSAEVLRETYSAIVKTMSARSTMDSQVERTHLKSLGAWLGSLTLAQDKPIKHRNIYFVDLLHEGFETHRLIIVIPFTCKVLVQGKDSVVFKPPNPWLMEILGVLLELYHHADLRLNLKFEIEVLCKDLNLDHKKVEPSNMIREYRAQQTIEGITTNVAAIENIEDYDLTLRGGRLRETFTVADIMQSLPSLDSVLRYPPPSGGQQEQNAVKQIINKAVQRAIEEIIAPVVERSITIASLSTSQLVSKDYSVEPNPDSFSNAAREMVKSLAGSLALVTCKEPLRMSIQNYIRQYLEEIGGAFMAEGQILMTVNDNLDIAAQLIKEAAEQRAVPEMDQVIEADLNDRQRFLTENSGGDYYGQTLNRWATWIPEPYKMIPGSLNEAQRAVYEDFERRVHGMNAGHLQNASADSTARQLPDILNETLAMPNLSTPAGQPVMPHQSPLIQHESGTSVLQQHRANGIVDNMPPRERVALLVEEVQKAARTSLIPRVQDLEKDSIIVQHMRQIITLLATSSHPVVDHISRQLADKVTASLLRQPPQSSLEAECLIVLLRKLCDVSEAIVRDVMRWITANEESLLTNSFVAVAFVRASLMDLSRVDGLIASAVRDHSEIGLRLLSDLMDQTLFNEGPMALRADFINSIVALYAWLKEQPDHPLASEVGNKLKAHGVPEFAVVALNDKTKAKQDQMLYVFQEWASLYDNSSYNEATYAAFLRDLHSSQLISSAEDLVTFLRLTIESSTEAFELEAQSFRVSFAAAFSRIDALALFVILLVKFQGEENGAVKISKPAYLGSILSLIVLIVNNHQEFRGTNFNQRVFTRLFASILYSFAEFRFDLSQEYAEFMLVFAKTFKSLQPRLIPAFAFGWTSLICHRVFIDGMLRHGDEECATQYRELAGLMLQYSAAAAEIPALQQDAEALIRGAWKNFFLIQNDFPDFVCANHAYFCSRLSLREPTTRNLILSAHPLGLVEPNPLTPNLRVERIEDMKKAPVISADVSQPLEAADILAGLQSAFGKTADLDHFVKQMVEIFKEDVKQTPSFGAPAFDCEILCSLVVVVAQDALHSGTKFDPEGNHAQLISKLLNNSQPRHKYLLVTALFDQLRYPNTHTEYFCKQVLHIWGTTTEASESHAYIREIIIRVLRERIDALRPNPWGALVVFKELSDNPAYGFWRTQPFIIEPELRQRLVMAARGGGH
ncbi:CCR4-NOT core subunit cdc39 [Lithohypha guttulata]|uniref:CCR4-NOT core subunit cdc39 n=1 Tax=Lithohypha guttulata TaxID=1690604 RepID=UPI002DDFADD6|nr:CCR4-NOT core subunit cdc39 [Lithohypha guttulata]